MAEQIRAIVFDAGGVLHEPNEAVSEDIACELGLSEEQISEIWSTEIEDLSRGKISEAAVWERVSERYDVRRVSEDENLLGRAFEEHYAPQRNVSKLVDRIWYRVMPKLGLLSNTIEPHARVMRERTNNFQRFNAVSLSYETGFRKPEEGAFMSVLDQLGVSPEDAIMVDNDEVNVAAATQIGMIAVLYEGPQQLDRELSQYVRHSI